MIITWQLKQLEILIRGCPEGRSDWQTQLKAKDRNKTDRLQTFPAPIALSRAAIGPEASLY